MPTMIQRLGAAVRAFAAIPAPPVPDTPPGPFSQGRTAPPKTVDAVNSLDALFGRTTYGAGPGLTRYSTYPADAIDPQKVQAIFKQANNGYPRLQAELYEQLIESDSHLGSVALARIYEVSGKEPRIRAAGEAPVALSLAKFVKASIDNIDSFDRSIESLLWANAFGYSISEIVWESTSLRFPDEGGTTRTFDGVIPKSIEWVHQKHVEFDAATDAPYLYIDGRISPPPAKFIYHEASEPGFVCRRGYMRPCTLLLAAKRWSIRDWLNYAHLYGVPQLELLYDGTIEEYNEHRALYEKILRDFGQGIPAIHPESAKIQITNPPPGGRANDPQGALIGWANSEISKRVQGETLTTEMGGVGGYNTADIHADVKHAFIVSDARKLAATLRRQLITPLVELNMTGLCRMLGATPDEIRAVIPSIRWRIEREMKPTERRDIILSFVNAGLSVDEEQIRDEFGIDAPRPGGAALKGEPVQIGSGGVVGSNEAARKGAEPPPDATPAPAPNVQPGASSSVKEAPAPNAGTEPKRPATDGAPAPEKPSRAE